MGGQEGAQHSGDRDSVFYLSDTLHIALGKQECTSYSPVQIVWSIPRNDGNWDVVHIIVGKLNKKLIILITTDCKRVVILKNHSHGKVRERYAKENFLKISIIAINL